MFEKTKELLKNLRNHCRCVCVLQCCVGGNINEDIDVKASPANTPGLPNNLHPERQFLLDKYFHPNQPNIE